MGLHIMCCVTYHCANGSYSDILANVPTMQRKAPDNFEGCRAPVPLGQNAFQFWCSATLINHRWLLTAKKCVKLFIYGEGCITDEVFHRAIATYLYGMTSHTVQ